MTRSKTLYVDMVDGNHYVFKDYKYAEIWPERDPWLLNVKDKDGNIIHFLLGSVSNFSEK